MRFVRLDVGRPIDSEYEMVCATFTIDDRTSQLFRSLGNLREIVEFELKPFSPITTETTKVIFNPPATILYMNGKKYVSKVHDEEFDEEKGLLMCLAKANGITHAELKRMIKGAKRQGGKQNDC